jgi:hypothetical protein
MKYIIYHLRFLLLMVFSLAVNNYAMAQCSVPVITSISNSSPVCGLEQVSLSAVGTVGGSSTAFVRMAGIGGNAGNREFDILFSSGDKPGTITRISNAQFDAIFASATTDAARATLLKAQYDVLMFTWASPYDAHITWGLMEAFLNLGGSIFQDGDYANIANLSPNIVGVQNDGSSNCSYVLVSPAPFPILVANGVNGCFVNNHLSVSSWPSWMHDYIRASDNSTVVAIAGIYPNGNHGRLIIQGPDQDFHAQRLAGDPGGNQYKIMKNQMDFLAGNQGNFTWSGPNGFTATGGNPVINSATSAMAGVYTATLTNTTGGGCYTTASTTVTVNAVPATGTISGTSTIYVGQTSALSSTISGGTWSSSNTGVATINSSTGVVNGVSGGSVVVTYSKTSGCTGYSTYAMTILECAASTTTFSYTGSVQSYTIPAGYTSVGIDLVGAGGGAGTCWSIGGKGGRVNCNLAVTPGQVLYIYVGGAGGNFTNSSTPAAGGFNGGGTGGGYGYYSGGGGGGTDIRTSASGSSYANRLVVGGGGGGTGYYYCAASDQGGSGGYPNGGSGIYGGTGSYNSTNNGAGGTQTAGGTGASSGGGNGSFGVGGNAGNYYYGGGGGGGYYGGGGSYIQGGGGGSSFYGGTGISSATTATGYQAGNGYVKIILPLSIAITSQPSGTTACSGASATFSVTATGPSISYQWQVNSGSGWSNISGANSSSYSFTASTGDNGNQFKCVMTGACSSSATSNAATLTVNSAPAVTCAGNVTAAASTGACSATVSYGAATATGTSPSISYSQNSGTTFSVGVTTVTATATNSCGSNSCSFTVTVNDTQAPVISVSNVSTNNDAGTCGASVTLSATATDNCSVTATPTNDWAGGAFPVGTTTVNWTVTDIHGNIGTATQTVTVTDNEAPVISVSNVAVNNATGTCGASVTLSATATDNCSVTATPANDWAGGAFPVGTTTVNWTVTDIHGNIGTATQTVTVTDNQAPVISVSNVAVNNATGTCGASVTLSATATDNCGVTATPTNDWAGGAFPVGTTTVNWTVTDIHGNIGTATQTVTVTDNQAPVISVSNVAVNNATGTCGASVTLSATATDNCSVTATPTNDWAGGAFPVGTTTVNWTVTDIHGNTGTATQTVTVTDNQAPVISVSNVSVNNDAGTCGASVTLSATATDNCGVTATPTNDWAGGAFPVGTTTVNWTVTDIHGNTGTATQTVTVTDNQAPVISVSNVAVNNATGTCGASVTLSATATDNCGVTATPTNDWAGGAFPVGTTTVNWTVTDIHGNTGTATQTVTVTDNENPTITAPANITANNTTGACGTTVSLGSPTTADNCGVASVTNNHSSATYPVGTTSVIWTVTDIHGHTATATQTVTVIDNEAPHAICQNYTLNLSGGTGSVSATNINNGSYDNCGIASMSVYPNSFNCSNAGSNTVTLTVTDVHGNTSTCTATVIVRYQPTCSIAVTKSDTTYTGGIVHNIYFGYGAQAATFTGTATGGSGFTYSWSPSTYLSSASVANPTFTPTAAGHYTYTLTATNSNGCSTTCTVSMCVVDAIDHAHSNKVILCHIPPGNPGNPQQLSISINAVGAHLSGHTGDHLGACYSGCGIGAKDNTIAEVINANVRIYPNPTAGSFNVVIPATESEAIVQVTDMTGRILATRIITDNHGDAIEFNLTNLATGIYFVKVKAGEQSFVEKLIVR